MPPTSYDPSSPDEQPVQLPSQPLVRLAPNVMLQPPLTRRGTGPGLIIFLPSQNAIQTSTRNKRPLDPEPQMKWAEEGLAVVARTSPSDSNSGWSVEDTLKEGQKALCDQSSLDTRDKFAIIVYDPDVTAQVLSLLPSYSFIKGAVVYGALSFVPNIPVLLHQLLSSDVRPPSSASQPLLKVHSYSASSPHFVLPRSKEYSHGAANLAHSRTLTFIRSALGGPIFDIEAIWDEHTYFEFEVRSVAKTMGTMVQEPYVNHVPTMAGGVGREKLTAFYRDHFIFTNPLDTKIEPVSRTVGPDRVVDEFLFTLTHTQMVDWLLPGVPPTGRKLRVPFVAVVNVRGDRLYHEHIWWDHASLLKQAGLLPDSVSLDTERVRLPVVGEEGGRLLADETDGTSNQMLDPSWGMLHH